MKIFTPMRLKTVFTKLYKRRKFKNVRKFFILNAVL